MDMYAHCMTFPRFLPRYVYELTLFRHPVMMIDDDDVTIVHHTASHQRTELRRKSAASFPKLEERLTAANVLVTG